MTMEDLNELMTQLLDKESITNYGYDSYTIATNALGISSGCFFNKKENGEIYYQESEDEVKRRIDFIIKEKKSGKYFYQAMNDYFIQNEDKMKIKLF